MRLARLNWFEGVRGFARLRWFAIPALILVLVVLGAVLPTYWVYLLSAVAVGSLIARSIGLITNQAGLITLCQLSFAAIGGWAVSWLALRWPDAPFPLLVLIGGVAVAPVGLLIGIATARIRGVELAVVTLGFAAALDLVLRQGSFPGVGEGTPVIPAAPFDDPLWFFALAWALLILLQLRSSERAAAALGVRVGLAKASAFGLGALLAGVAGGLLAGQYGLLTTAAFSPLNSLVQLATAVLCGAGLFSGAVLAGAFGVFVPEVLRRVGLPLDVANALLAVGAFDVLRRGNGGIMEQLNEKVQDRSFRNTRVTCELEPATEKRDRPAGEVAPQLPQGPPEAVARVSNSAVRPAMPPAVSPAWSMPTGPLESITPTARTAPVTGLRDSAQPAPRLEVSNLTVTFGADRALDAVDLRVCSGEVHALIGPNGAGKSTLIDAVSGFLAGQAGRAEQTGGAEPTGGTGLSGDPPQHASSAGLDDAAQRSSTVMLDGVPVDGHPARARAKLGIRRTFQRLRVMEALTVDEYLRLAGGHAAAAAAATTTIETVATVATVRKFFGLPGGDVPIRLMDVGSRRILEIAGALAAQPRVLMLDEPAAGLAEAESIAVAERLRRIPVEFGVAVLLVEHDMSVVRAAASRVTVLDEGRVIASGPTAQVLSDERVVAAYLGQEAAR